MLILAPKKFEQHGYDQRWADHVLSAHDLQRGDEGHPDRRVHYRVVLLEHVYDFVAQVVCQLVFVDPGDVS